MPRLRNLQTAACRVLTKAQARNAMIRKWIQTMA
jgi:hypothetical protein